MNFIKILPVEQLTAGMSLVVDGTKKDVKVIAVNVDLPTHRCVVHFEFPGKKSGDFERVIREYSIGTQFMVKEDLEIDD